MGGYSDVVMNESHLSTTCTAAAGDNDVYFLEGGWRGRLINSFDSCLARTSNIVQASLVVRH